MTRSARGAILPPEILRTLLGDLAAFYSEHRRCGDLDAEVTDSKPGWVAMECTCGALIARRIQSSERPETEV